jgi:hypothetical protein
LLFGGAIQLAGHVQAKRNRRSTQSDWMAIERERGISVVTSVMTFEYDGLVFNLLDTPGHEDFSEDTYRTLTAVDSAVMVIDAAKGDRGAHRKCSRFASLARHPEQLAVRASIPFRRIDHHDGGVDRGERAVGVLGEVLVARRVEQLKTRLSYSKVITEVTTEMPRSCSIAIQSDWVESAVCAWL